MVGNSKWFSMKYHFTPYHFRHSRLRALTQLSEAIWLPNNHSSNGQGLLCEIDSTIKQMQFCQKIYSSMESKSKLLIQLLALIFPVLAFQRKYQTEKRKKFLLYGCLSKTHSINKMSHILSSLLSSTICYKAWFLCPSNTLLGK